MKDIKIVSNIKFNLGSNSWQIDLKSTSKIQTLKYYLQFISYYTNLSFQENSLMSILMSH